MSAYIVDRETMDRVVTAIATHDNPPRHPDEITALGRELYALNLRAVLARYPNDTKETAPGPCDISDIHDNFTPRRSNATRVQLFKAMRCFLYQCSEGDVPDSDLFKAVERFADEFGAGIDQDGPEYQAAAWS